MLMLIKYVLALKVYMKNLNTKCYLCSFRPEQLITSDTVESIQDLCRRPLLIFFVIPVQSERCAFFLFLL